MGNGILFYNRTGFFTLLMREIRRFMKLSVQTVLAPLLSNILYLAVFGGILKTRQVGIEGVNYLIYLVPGLATMGAIFSAFQNPSFSIVSQKLQNTIYDLNSYPISDTEKALAFILGGTFRGSLIGMLTYIAAAIFVGFRVEYPAAFIFMLGVTAFIFASLGTFCGLLFNSFEKINFALSIVITPLAYLGGVFFETSGLPGALSFTKYINPVFPLVNITRYAYLGIYEGNIMIHIITTGFFMIGLFILTVQAFKRGLGVKTE